MQARVVHCRALVVLLAVLAVCAASPSLASSPNASIRGKYRGECRRLTKQIKHYEGTILPMAVERRNAAWKRATEQQITRLWHQRADLCPQYKRQRTLMARAAAQARRFNQMIASAAKAAATYFSGGMAP